MKSPLYLISCSIISDKNQNRLHIKQCHKYNAYVAVMVWLFYYSRSPLSRLQFQHRFGKIKKNIEKINNLYLRLAVYPPTIIVSSPIDIDPWYRRPLQILPTFRGWPDLKLGLLFYICSFVHATNLCPFVIAKLSNNVKRVETTNDISRTTCRSCRIMRDST